MFGTGETHWPTVMQQGQRCCLHLCYTWRCSYANISNANPDDSARAAQQWCCVDVFTCAMTPSSVQMSNPFAHSVSWALVTHSLSTTNFFPLLPKLKFHFHGNTRTLNKKVVESVAVALPWVAVQIQMTLPALRSVRSRRGGGAFMESASTNIHQHCPAKGTGSICM